MTQTKLPTSADPVTQAPVTRLTGGEGNFLLPYYTASAVSSDGRYLCCTRERDGIVRPCIVDLTCGELQVIETGPGDDDPVLLEAVTFHPTRPLLFFAAEHSVWKHELETGQTKKVYHTGEGFLVKSEISCGNEHLVFWVYEQIAPGVDGNGKPPRGFHMMRQCRSYIFAVNIESGAAEIVWGDVAPLTHPVIHPQDENLVLYANQGTIHRSQELFTIARSDRDNRKPVKVYSGYDALDETPIYVGHSFITSDGWVACQMVEFAGRQPNGTYLDMVGYNAIARPDGSCRRRARCPGGNKPIHVHARTADGFWVGDTLPGEGSNDANLISLMKNNWETGFVQAEPLCAHGCSHSRPNHVHAQFMADGQHVLFNSDYHGQCGIYLVDAGEAMSNWKDVTTFERRPQRFYQSPTSVLPPTVGPPD